MKRRQILIAAAIGVGASLLVPAMSSAAADLLMLADNGMFEHVYSSSGPPQVDTVQFVWIPEGAPGSTAYALSGSCKHLDLNSGNLTGNYKAKFSKVRMLGIDSGNTAKGSNKASKVKKGLPQKFAIWDLGPVGSEYASSDSGVLVTAKVKVTGQVRSGSYLQCFLAVVEGDAGLFSTASSVAEREAIFNELALSAWHLRPQKPVE